MWALLLPCNTTVHVLPRSAPCPLGVWRCTASLQTTEGNESPQDLTLTVVNGTTGSSEHIKLNQPLNPKLLLVSALMKNGWCGDCRLNYCRGQYSVYLVSMWMCVVWADSDYFNFPLAVYDPTIFTVYVCLTICSMNGCLTASVGPYKWQHSFSNKPITDIVNNLKINVWMHCPTINHELLYLVDQFALFTS